jgi:hypothetical protein
MIRPQMIRFLRIAPWSRGLAKPGRNLAASSFFAALLVISGLAGCMSPNTCPPYPQYPAYQAFPGQQSFGVPTAAAPPAGTFPAGTVPMTAQPPVYGQPITGGVPTYPTAPAVPPGYAQPMVGR